MTKQVRLSVDGQATITEDVRESLGLRPGEMVAFERDGDRVFVRKGDVPAGEVAVQREAMQARIAEALRLFPPLPMDVTTDEYMALIREPAPDPAA